jgi:hypothetical protein
METEQRARICWRERSFHLSYWSEAGSEKEVLLGGLTDFLIPQKYLVSADTGWSNWDLKIARGLCSRCLVTVCAENHGGSKRLLRVRCAMRLSHLALFLLRGYAALTAFALILGWPLVAAVVAGMGMVNIGAVGWQLVDFGRLMHRIVETVAKQARLAPLEAAWTRRAWVGDPYKSGDSAVTCRRNSDTPLVRKCRSRRSLSDRSRVRIPWQ